MIGIGIPATIFALVKGTSKQATPLMLAMSAGIEAEVPAWNGLLIVYGSLYLPVIFAMLFELNLDAWVNARINYEVGIPLGTVADVSSSWSCPDLSWTSGHI